MFIYVCSCSCLFLKRVVIVALEEVATEATAVILVFPLVEPASARILQVIALIYTCICNVILAIVEPEANKLLLLARQVIIFFVPILCFTQVNATALLSVNICYTENILCESCELTLKYRVLLQFLQSCILLLLPLIAILTRNLLFIKGTVLPESMGWLVFSCIWIQLEGCLGNIRSQRTLVGHHFAICCVCLQFDSCKLYSDMIQFFQ